jgi:hypothetical protein
MGLGRRVFKRHRLVVGRFVLLGFVDDDARKVGPQWRLYLAHGRRYLSVRAWV